MHRISWNQIEQAQGTYLWADNLDDIFTQLPFGQDASLNLIEEPCYILGLTNPPTVTWCDTRPPAGSTTCTLYTCTGGNLRAVPWDKNLMTRRESYISQMASHLQSTGNLAKVSIINTNLPGGDSGIRNCDGHGFSAMGDPSHYTIRTG